MFNLLTFMHPASFLKQRLYFDKCYKAMNYWTKSVDKDINILGHITVNVLINCMCSITSTMNFNTSNSDINLLRSLVDIKNTKINISKFFFTITLYINKAMINVW